ncbi:hypothetical protein [Marinobacter piscensis]|uniref:hypothetical protein n=1 Tax=Marinobacter piscensis TaxID=1562308 RepID=UPI00119DDD54|nr:hypothetical protein [Marinobacter piscensis]
MNKDIQSKKSILEQGADKTLRLNIPIPDPETARPEEVIHYRVLVGQAWIERDIEQNFLPSDISSFPEVGTYCDHNMYLIDDDLRGSKIGSFYEWGWNVQKICDHFNAVADALDGWLRSGREGSAANYIDIKASFS